MRRPIPYIAVLLVCLMTPGAGALLENLVHLVESGRAAHALDDDAHEPEGPEPCCSGPYHACSCHTSTAFTVASVACDVASPQLQQAGLVGSTEAPPADGCLSSVFRPPIA